MPEGYNLISYILSADIFNEYESFACNDNDYHLNSQAIKHIAPVVIHSFPSRLFLNLFLKAEYLHSNQRLIARNL